MVRINPAKPTSLKTTKPEELSGVLEKQKAAFNKNSNSPWAERKANLKKLGDVIKSHEADFVKAISQDFGHRANYEPLELSAAACCYAAHWRAGGGQPSHD